MMKMDMMHMDEQGSFRGFVVGEVCGYGSDEYKGTLQVKLPYMDKDEDILENVKLLLGYGGSSYGFVHRPEIGDLVLLTFLGEHSKNAIALGCIAPQDTTIFNEISEKNEQKEWKMKHGVHLQVWDEPDKSKVEVTCGDFSLKVDEEQKEMCVTDGDTTCTIAKEKGTFIIEAKEELQLKCGKSSLVLKKDGTGTWNGEKIAIQGQDMKVDMKMNTSISAQKTTIDSKIETAISGKSSVKISASGITEVSGGLVKLG